MTDDAGPPPAEVIDVLVVEDSRVQSEALRLGLERRGYRVRVAADGAEGLVAVREQAPDLIITDIDMPNMDGYQLCEEIKNDSQLRSIPVILLTSLGEPEDIFRGLEVRADNYLTKPFEELEELEAETALELLTKGAKTKEIEVVVKKYDFGSLVESIGGKANSAEKAWIYFLNGESATQGADQYKLVDGDVIEWKYIKPIF